MTVDRSVYSRLKRCSNPKWTGGIFSLWHTLEFTRSSRNEDISAYNLVYIFFADGYYLQPQELLVLQAEHSLQDTLNQANSRGERVSLVVPATGAIACAFILARHVVEAAVLTKNHLYTAPI
jgi:hypothetical protein